MANEQTTFDKLPQAVGYLIEQMKPIRQIAALQPQTSFNKHRLIEIDEVYKITWKAKPTLYTLARKGLIPAYKWGKKPTLWRWIAAMDWVRVQAEASNVTSGTGDANSTWSKAQTKGRLYLLICIAMEPSKLTAEGIIGKTVRPGAKMPEVSSRQKSFLSRFSVSLAICTIVRTIPWIMVRQLSLLSSGAGEAQPAGKSHSV